MLSKREIEIEYLKNKWNMSRLGALVLSGKKYKGLVEKIMKKFPEKKVEIIKEWSILKKWNNK